jgi:ABC-type transporter Mla MlaB component
MAKKPAPSPRSLALEGDLDVFSVHQQWEQAQPLMAADSGTVEVDLSGIGDMDLSGLQLLSVLDRDLRSRGVELQLTGVKDEWKTRFLPLGMAGLFGGVHP